MSENVIMQHINDVRSRRAIWRKLSDGGKRRVLELANGDVFMLDMILEDVLDEERGK